MELRYADDNKLFVPVEHLDLVQKYSGGGNPQLDRLGGTTWEKAKTRVKKAMRDMADELLKLYATRKAVPGHAFGADTHWQEEFEQAFEYELTSDQKVAIADIKNDMESPTPMDRLLCGDVGYGKTEVAMRAAFKAVMDGRQVAVPGADDGAGVPAPAHAAVTVRGVPGQGRHGQPVPLEGGAEGHAGQPGGRQAGHHRRDASPALEGRGLPRSRAAGRRRGAALRRRPQGAHQADAPQGRRADDERDADSAHAQHVAGRHPRHVGDRDAAARPPGDPDQRRGLRPEGDRRRGAARAGARRPGLSGAQPRRVDPLDCRPRAAAGAGSEDHRRPRPDGRGRAREGDGRLRRAQVRRAGRDHDHRERARHPQRQHDDHQPRRPLRAGAALSAARPRRPVRSPGLRLPAGPARPHAVAGRPEAAVGDARVQRPRQPASASPPSTSRSAVPATCSAASRAATSSRSASRCT